MSKQEEQSKQMDDVQVFISKGGGKKGAGKGRFTGCARCGLEGHWSKECNVNLKKLKQRQQTAVRKTDNEHKTGSEVEEED